MKRAIKKRREEILIKMKQRAMEKTSILQIKITTYIFSIFIKLYYEHFTPAF